LKPDFEPQVEFGVDLGCQPGCHRFPEPAVERDEDCDQPSVEPGVERVDRRDDYSGFGRGADWDIERGGQWCFGSAFERDQGSYQQCFELGGEQLG
jgi:hypothetical protein